MNLSKVAQVLKLYRPAKTCDDTKGTKQRLRINAVKCPRERVSRACYRPS